MIVIKEYSAIAFFDFDGTVTKKDTFLHFIFFVKGKFYSLLGITVLLPVFILYKIRLISNEKAKELVFSFFFKGIKESFLKKKGQQFVNIINKMLRSEAIEKINWHKSQNHKIFIVTASSNIWVEEWCKQNNLNLISTMYKIEDDFITGKILGKNCHGNEKVNRINAECNLSEYIDIYAYGDTKGDLPMLRIANHAFYCRF